MEQTGATAWRVGFNGGDAFFWRNKARFIAHAEGLEVWPAVLSTIIAEKPITDIVLYGDTRPIHAEAIKLAKPICGAKTCPAKTVTGLALQTCFKAGYANLD